MITSPPSPLQELSSQQGVRIFVKRDDLLATKPGDPFCGNKWRKLKYNLDEASKAGQKRLLTFGGPYSNHIAAVASAGQQYGFQTVGIIRGEPHHPLNPTLAFACSAQMTLEYIDRKNYRLKEGSETYQRLAAQYAPFYLIPEGGTNHLALKGCRELAAELKEQLNGWPDYICVSCGTGGTMAGLISGTETKVTTVGFSALKGDFHRKEIAALVGEKLTDWEVRTEYHFGGYAKFNDALIQFINDFHRQHEIQLDPVYTGKLFYGVFDLIAKGYFREGSRVVVIHSGGLQGVAGFNQRFGEILV